MICMLVYHTLLFSVKYFFQLFLINIAIFFKAPFLNHNKIYIVDIYAVANSVYQGDLNLEKLWMLDYDAAKTELLKLYGVDDLTIICIHIKIVFPNIIVFLLRTVK